MPSRRAWTITGAAVAVVAAGAIGGPLVYAATQEDAAPARTVQDVAAGSSSAAASGAATGTADVELDGTWTISTGSSAGYRVEEVLNGADVTVAGTTDEVTGTLTVTDGDLTAGEIDVDVASITTDSDRRDSQFSGDIMETATYPTATFVVTETVDLPELSGSPVTVAVTGELTLHGVTQEVTVDLSVITTDAGVEASGSIPVTFADYDVDAPDLGFVQVEDTGAVEFYLVLEQ